MKPRRLVAVIPRLFQNYDRKILLGISSYVRTHGGWSLWLEESMQRIPDLNSWHGDGLIVNFDDRSVAEAIESWDKPVVGYGGGKGWHEPGKQIPYVETDDAQIARLAAEHLLERGFKHFAFCGLPPTRTNVWIAKRERAFQDAVVSAGFGCHRFKGRFGNARRWERMQQELCDWLDHLPKPLGLMACYDPRARHVLEACHTLGLKVPEDVAVVGVDNDPISCELADPPLSSVEQGCHRIGYAAAELLDRMMDGQPPAQMRNIVPPVGVQQRRSTDMLALEDDDVVRGMRLIRDKACDGLTVDQVADKLGWSRSKLDNRFKAAVGTTAHRQIQKARLTQAKQMLVQTDLPLKQVARRAGFTTIQYLCAVILEETGQTPTQYRLDQQKGQFGPTAAL